MHFHRKPQTFQKVKIYNGETTKQNSLIKRNNICLFKFIISFPLVSTQFVVTKGPGFHQRWDQGTKKDVPCTHLVLDTFV